jgi:hypothetical protein
MTLLTTKQVSQSTGIAIDTLQNWRSTGVGPPYVKLGQSSRGHVRYRIEDVVAWQQACERVIPAGWQPIGEGVPGATERIQWLPPGQTAAALGIPIPTLIAWYRRAVGLPFVWIGGRGQHQFIYDLRDVEAFISRRKVDPSVVPVIAKRKPGKDPRTREERKQMLAEVLKSLGFS